MFNLRIGGLFFHCFVKLLMEVHGFENTEYIVSNLAYGGTWFQEYRI